ncbi:MAG: 50S ribosomal protein L3 [Bacteriovoracaceae bacterium]|nr:50S ribosomal protein L3 [Bacteriovoracaceae bacterium]
MTEDNNKDVSAPEEKKSEKKSVSVDVPVFYGIKAGMTRIFNDDGSHVPVTVVKLIPNIISQVKVKEKDGYEAYQVAYNEKRAKLVSKPKEGHLKKAGIEKSFFRFAEIRMQGVDPEHLGKEISLESFQPASIIDVTGVSKGKGFQGVIKRYNFSGGPATHGSSTHRAPGSVGNCASPGHIFKNKKMPGHMGSKKKTVQNLEVVEVNQEKGYMLLKGSVPGHKNSFIRISKAIKG